MPIMETIRIFKISENQKGFDTIMLIYDKLDNLFIVKWKWTTMRNSIEKSYNNYEEAYERYQERKKFAITCN